MSKSYSIRRWWWAIALAKILYGNGHNVTIWSALQKEVDLLSKDRENKISLPGIKIPEDIIITNDIEEVLLMESEINRYGSCIIICEKYIKTY